MVVAGAAAAPCGTDFGAAGAGIAGGAGAGVAVGAGADVAGGAPDAMWSL